jgi:putative holliday junction resolvase
MKRALGIDYGSRRVGIALSDPTRMFAQALETLSNSPQNPRGLIRAIEALIIAHEVDCVVVGWPLRLNGKEGIQTRKVDRFIQALSRAIDLPIHRWDERLTTTAAERVLIEGKLGREKRKSVIDQVAATLILQGWLDFEQAQAPPLE